MEKGTPKSGKSPTKIPSTQVQTKKFTARQKQSKIKKTTKFTRVKEHAVQIPIKTPEEENQGRINSDGKTLS